MMTTDVRPIDILLVEDDPGDELITREAFEHNKINNILHVARDGRLWIGTREGLASWKDGKLAHYPELAGQAVQALLEDREGVVWVGVYATSNGRLCAIQKGGVQCYGDDERLSVGVVSLYEDRKANLWVGVRTGVWRWKPGPPTFIPLPGEPGDAELRSGGTGFDILPGQKITASLAWAKALTTASVTHAGNSRVLFFLRGTF